MEQPGQGKRTREHSKATSVSATTQSTHDQPEEMSSRDKRVNEARANNNDKSLNSQQRARNTNNKYRLQRGNGGILSLSCVAVAVATVLILITAAVVLVVTVVYSLKAANEFADSYSKSNIVAAVSKVNDFVSIPLNTYSEIKLAAFLGYMPNLVTGTHYIDTDNKTNATAIALLDEVRRDMYLKWLTRMQAMVFAANFNLLYVGIGLEDHTWMSCTVTNAARFTYDMVFINPRNVTHELYNAAQSPPRNNNYRFARRYTNRTMPNSPYETHSTSTLNPPTRPWYINAPKGPLDDPIFSNVYPDFTLGVSIVDVNGPLYSQDGVFLGVTSLSLELRRISSFLHELPKTSNSITALVDGQGFLLGASDEQPLSTSSAPFTPAAGPPPTLPAGCEQFLNGTSGLATIVCRLTPGSYTNTRLSALYREYNSVFDRDGLVYTKSLTINGELCMVSKAPITAKTELVSANIKWQMYTVMPVGDVTGQIVTGRNVAIIIACVMVTVSCAVCVVALYFLLKPLSILAELMAGASELNDETLGTQLKKSHFREIGAIQDSFSKLSQQLKRAKSFLPAALLAQLDSSMDDEDEEEEGGDGSGGEENDDYETAASSYAKNVRDAVSNGRETHASSSTTVTRVTVRRPRVGGKNGGARGDARTTLPSTINNDGAENDRSTIGLKVLSSNVSLVSKTVTIAALNLRDFHSSLSSSSSSPSSLSGPLESSYGNLVDAFQSTAKECRGILDSFHGDRFFFTFNAVRPCGTHATMAATAMLKIVSLIAQQHSLGATNNESTNNNNNNDDFSNSMNGKVTCGIATGRCHVGNLGSDRAKRFTVIGHAFSFATILERLCKNYPQTPILMSHETLMDCETVIGSLAMDIIRTSKKSAGLTQWRGAGPNPNGGATQKEGAPLSASHLRSSSIDDNFTVVSAPLYAKGAANNNNHNNGLMAIIPNAKSAQQQNNSGGAATNKLSSSNAQPVRSTSNSNNNNNKYNSVNNNDEWMYEILENSENCHFQYANNAFRAVLAGDTETARKQLDAFKDDSPQSQCARERIACLIEDISLGKHVEPANLGIFYDRCVLNLRQNEGKRDGGKVEPCEGGNGTISVAAPALFSPTIRVFEEKSLK